MCVVFGFGVLNVVFGYLSAQDAVQVLHLLLAEVIVRVRLRECREVVLALNHALLRHSLFVVKTNRNSNILEAHLLPNLPVLSSRDLCEGALLANRAHPLHPGPGIVVVLADLADRACIVLTQLILGHGHETRVVGSNDRGAAIVILLRDVSPADGPDCIAPVLSCPAHGILAPRGLPRPLVMQLNREFNRILEISDVREKALAQGTDLESQTPEQFGAFLVAQTTKWAKVAKAAGMRAD